MTPNTIELPVSPDPEIIYNGNKAQPSRSVPEKNYRLEIIQSFLSLLAHVFVGSAWGVSVMFAFRNGLPLAATPMHIVLCVTGYQLLMAEAILSLSSEGGWSSKLTLMQRRRAHWILQIGGSGLAIGGTFHKILSKEEHFNTLHGVFGLVALVFTVICLLNGLASLYAFELRKFLPGNVSKVTHICFGIIAFAASSVCLCLGFAKTGFRNWSTKPLSDTFIAFVAILTFVVIFNPLITFFNKSRTMLRK